jgi:hypothetical protein
MRQGNLMVDLRNLYKDDPQLLKKIDIYESQIETAKKAMGDNQNIISMNKHELAKTVTDRPDVLQIVEAGKAKISQIHGPQPASGTPHGKGQKHIGHDHDGDGTPDH